MGTIIIYMPLRNEGTTVWRPVAAEPLGGDRYRIVDKIPEDEEWEFPPGEMVIARAQQVGGEQRLVAVDRVGLELTALERAALHGIFAETPELTAGLLLQLEFAIVKDRKNTGAGFFTTISVSDEVERVECARVLGYETHARIEGLSYGLGFVLFMENGRLNLLEGYSCGGEDTSFLPLSDLVFQISKTPFDP